jgi:hypothetical protein
MPFVNSPETYVQVAADGSGKKIRNVGVEVLLADGSTETRYMQVVSVADADGVPWGPTSNDELLLELRAIREMLELAFGSLDLH